MEIVLTYDSRWEYSPEGQTPFWKSLDTVDYVRRLFEETGNRVRCIKTVDQKGFEKQLNEIQTESPETLVFWLNEFLPPDYSSGEKLTVSVFEKLGMMHVGPSSKAQEIGLDKEATKNVFRKLGLKTPDSYIVNPSDYSPIEENANWNGHVIIKPLLQGNSKGMDENCVLEAFDSEAIRAKCEQIHKQFKGESALVEKYIGGENVREFTVPIFINNEERVTKLPITEIDLSSIPKAQEKFKFLFDKIKDETYYLRVAANLSEEVTSEIRKGVKAIIREIGCKDMTRIDLRQNSSGLYFIEVNVCPGKNKFSYLTVAAQKLGIEHRQLIAYILHQAMCRNDLQPPKKLAKLVEPITELFKQDA